MQYNFINNITSNGVKGSAILGIFSDLSVNSLSKSINATNLKKINAAIKKSGFGGKINEKLCIYESVGSKFEKVYLMKKYSQNSQTRERDIILYKNSVSYKWTVHFYTNFF